MLTSWGNYPKTAYSNVIRPSWPADAIPFDASQCSFLPYGQGRSYGDSCLNENGILLQTSNLNRFISFDPISGILRCEAGITFKDILHTIVPHGWFLPIVPGTQFISLGGAIANDIHGKNHYRAGTFGRHVTCFELIRSDGTKRLCSMQNNSELFKATIGGLGLTGLILWAEIQLIPIKSAYLNVEKIKFKHIDDFFSLNQLSEKKFDYTVAWIDCTQREKSLGRGVFMRANFSDQGPLTTGSSHALSIPCNAPNFLLNHYTTKALGYLYYHKQRKATAEQFMPYQNFFFQLDAVRHWNRTYGNRGFLQYQCVVPVENSAAIKKFLRQVAFSKLGSFLSMLKIFGDLSSPGMLSFPCKGITLALDFPNNGKPTLDLLNELDTITMECGGRVYPAKDARMSGEAFQRYYPNWKDFLNYKDPKFSSNLWRRVTQTT